MDQIPSPFPPPQANQRLAPGASSAPADSMAPPAPNGQTRPRGRHLAIAVVVIVALALTATWFATRRQATNAASGFAADIEIPAVQPELQFTLPGGASSDGLFTTPPVVEGTPDDLYVAIAGDDGTTVSHRVDGEESWTVAVGLFKPRAIVVSDDRVMVATAGVDHGWELVGLNIATGAQEWSITAEAQGEVRSNAGRYYVATGGGFARAASEVIEFDPETGAELKRIDGTDLYPVEAGYASLDPSAGQVQLIDFDLEPVGEPVEIHTAVDWVFDRTDEGWLYLTDEDGSYDLKLIGRSPSGEQQFACSISVDGASAAYWFDVYRLDKSTVVAQAQTAIAVFKVDGSTCTSRWSLPRSQDRFVVRDDSQLKLYELAVDEDGDAKRFGDDTKVDIVDPYTGTPVASGVNDLFVDANGRLLTRDGDAIVAKEVDNGNELWRISAPENSQLSVLGNMIVVVRKDTSTKTSTIDIYAS